MESNMNTNYQARQLRIVKLQKQVVKFFKFVFFPSYVNPINVFNQVSLIAISVYGQRYHPKPLDDLKDRGILPLDAILDSETLDKLRELEYLKRDAINCNDFEKASERKQQIQKLKSGIQALAILQKRKKQAVRREDYEEAKKIYQKMKKIRGHAPRNILSSNDPYNEHKILDESQGGKHWQTVQQIKKKSNQNLDDEESSIKKAPQQSPIEVVTKGKILPQLNKSKILNVDEIRVGPKSSKSKFEDEQFTAEEGRGNALSLGTKQAKESLPSQKANPNRTSLQNKPLSQTDAQLENNHLSECQQYYPVVSEMIFNNIFSNDKNLREHGLDETLNLIDKIQHEDFFEKLFINAVIFIVKNVIDDKIILILLKAIELFGLMFKEYKPKPQEITRENSKSLKYILEKLSEFIGHSNDKLKSEAEDVYIVLPNYSKNTSKQLCIQTITLNEKIDRLPRPIISKLEMLGKLIRKYDTQALNLSKSSTIGLKKQKYEDVIEYAKRFLEDRNSEVRSTALKLLIYIGKILGTQQLLKSLSDVQQQILKKMRKNLEQNANYQEVDKFVLRNQNQMNLASSPPKKSRIKQIQSLKLSTNNSQIAKENLNKNLDKSKNHSLRFNNQQTEHNFQPQNPEYYCEYCESFDKRFENQNFREVHWYKSCPLIAICKECSQCVEVELLNQHLVQECQKKNFWKRCQRCRESVLAKQYNQHIEKKSCIPAKSIKAANRCPLCHEDIQPKKKGWFKHLIQEGCPCQKDRVAM